MKLFNLWETGKINVEDKGLKEYINLRPLNVPRTGGRNVKTQFWKSKNHIVERLMNKLMVSGHKGKKHKLSSGHNTGKTVKAYNAVEEAFKIIEKQTKRNPVEVFVKALENSAPREEITTIEYGGAKYPQSVECSPQRRIDLALRQMCQGSYAKSFKSKKKISSALAEEILLAYENNNKSQAIAKKIELERQAEASR